VPPATIAKMRMRWKCALWSMLMKMFSPVDEPIRSSRSRRMNGARA